MAACGRESAPLAHDAESPSAPTTAPVALTVDQLVRQITSGSGTPAGTVQLEAYVTNAPGGEQTSASPRQGCPIVRDRLPVLTDRPIRRTVAVAGVTLPNPVPDDLPALTLVIPYTLGIIEVPPRAHLEGHLGDPAYASCDGADRLFVLDRVVAALPAEPLPEPTAPATTGWPVWREATLGLSLSYPEGWHVSETRNAGAVVEALFGPSQDDATVRLTVLAGETQWIPTNADVAPPAPLAGDLQLAAKLGPAPARLVDATVPATQSTGSGNWREVRLVLNYQHRTVILATRFRDGAAVDPALLGIFTSMAASARFEKPVDASDPLDPTLTSRTELGPGPFISQAEAERAALAASGLHGAEVVEARLVPEREAREADPAGACRVFAERPEGVWLMTVHGTLPTGQEARRWIYLDATTGDSLCQTDASP